MSRTPVASEADRLVSVSFSASAADLETAAALVAATGRNRSQVIREALHRMAASDLASA